jgi:branched-chain amino acid aminotransferase
MIDTFHIDIQKTTNSRISELDENNIQFGKVYSDHMFMADFVDGRWQNVGILPYQDLKMSPANAALHYGESIFEGMKAYRSQSGNVALFRPLDNFKRMNISAERMCLQQIPEEIFMGGLRELINLDRLWIPGSEGASLYVRPFLFSMDAFIGVRPPETFRFMIIPSPAGAYYTEPVRVKIETHYSRAVEGGTGYAKAAGNYAAAMYPAKLAAADGYHQLIWTDAKEHKYIEESGTMNVMFLIGNKLITAPAGDTILNGITRDSVLKLAREWNIEVEERKLSVDELLDAFKSGEIKEAFGTGTAATIASIREIGNGDDHYLLPEDRPVADKLQKTLQQIKQGQIEDKFGWMEVV